MQYIVYVDYVFFLNFIMDYLILAFVNLGLRTSVRQLRILFSALIGAGGNIFITFLLPLPYPLKVLLGLIPFSVFMLWIMFGRRLFSFIAKAMISLYFFSFVLGGVLLFLTKYMPITGENFLFTMVLPAIVVYAMLYFFIKNYQQASNECEVEIFFENGSCKVKAFVDSGNMLYEPISKKPVCVIDESAVPNRENVLREEKCRVIPYHSVGKKSGILLGYEFDKMKVYIRGKVYDKNCVIIAVSKETVFANGKYQMLLHPKLLEGGI